MQELIGELERLRRRARLLLIVQRVSMTTAFTIAAVLGLVLLDYGLRLPAAIRLLFLLAGVAGLVVSLWRFLVPALSFRPNLTELALRVESSVPAVAGRLASSVEFALAGAERANPLAARSVRDTQSRLSGESIGAVMQPGRTVRSGMALVLLAAAAITIGVVNPTAAGTGLARLFAPYGAATWPARTAVASLLDETVAREGVHPRGQVLTLRARNLTPDGEAERVDVHFRVRENGRFTSWQHEVLTHQGDGVHERLVDTGAEAIEVWFATEDARTEPQRVEFVPSPAITRARLTVTPPAYAAGRVPPVEAELGTGVDLRGTLDGPVLVGSEAKVTLKVNKPLPIPGGSQRDAWVRDTFDWRSETALSFEVDDEEPTLWHLAWMVDGTHVLLLTLTDDYGLSNLEPITYRIEAVSDLPPMATITEPQSDETVLATAIVSIAAEATDDVAVSRIGLEAAVERSGTAPQPLPFAPQRQTDAVTTGIEAALDLSEFDLAEGDVIALVGVADDIFELDGQRHETVRSPARRLRIIGALDFESQVRRQLSTVRQNAIRIETMQSELQDDVALGGVQPGIMRSQGQIGDRIAAQREAVEQLQELVRRNRLSDEQLQELLNQSRDLLDYAGRAANEAVEAIEERAAEGGESASPRPDSADEDELVQSAPEDRPVVDAQQDVRDELGDLIELLDRDEDTWLVERQLEGLIETEAQLETQTARMAQETLGESREDLSEPQRSELDRIAQRQLEARDQFRRLVDEMRRRAEALEEFDPQAAESMQSAAETGERMDIDRDMEEAAERVAQNQLRSAGGSQQAASQKLQRMLEEMQETKRARAEELLRQLASLIESIERLIVVQENELIALATAEEADDFSGRDRAMIRLAQNTQSVATEARAAGQQARRIARTLDRAVDAEGAAVTALRAAPVDAAAARDAEERSLALLKEAKEQSEELQEKTQEEQVQQRREELIAAYRALAEKQIVIRADTIVLGGHEELTRRQLVEARRLGNEQNEIRVGVSDLGASTQEILQSDVFNYVHQLIDGWCDQVSEALWNGAVDVDATDRQQMIAESLLRQIDAIEESMSPPDEFADEQNRGGGGASGGQQPLIPPVAELKRVHGLQEQVYDRTRDIDAREDLSVAQRRQRLRELGGVQRELIRLGQEMLERMQQQAAPPPAPAPDAEPEPEPEPDTEPEPIGE